MTSVGDEEGYGVDRALSVALQDWMKELSLPLHPGTASTCMHPGKQLTVRYIII